MTELGAASRLLDVRTVYLEPQVTEFERGRQILDRFPDAERIEVDSHWQIPGLHGNEGNVRDWTRIKRQVLVLGVKKSLTARRNDRSSDFIAPSTANGCAMACSYCYVPRRKGYANPISVFVNIEQITRYLERHVGRQGVKAQPNQCDPTAWVYDIGENSDCCVDAAISDNVRDLVALFRRLPTAKASFATKFVNPAILEYEPEGRTRVRVSLMPDDTATKVDLRTSRIEERIAFIDPLVEAGYEVHLNFSPVIVHDGWLERWRELLDQVHDGVGPRARSQLKAEVIFLTHNEGLHEVNLGWHPTGETLLWRPEVQESKRSQNGGRNVRYRSGLKGRMVRDLVALIGERLPSCEVRYAF